MMSLRHMYGASTKLAHISGSRLTQSLSAFIALSLLLPSPPHSPAAWYSAASWQQSLLTEQAASQKQLDVFSVPGCCSTFCSSQPTSVKQLPSLQGGAGVGSGVGAGVPAGV